MRSLWRKNVLVQTSHPARPCADTPRCPFHPCSEHKAGLQGSGTAGRSLMSLSPPSTHQQSRVNPCSSGHPCPLAPPAVCCQGRAHKKTSRTALFVRQAALVEVLELSTLPSKGPSVSFTKRCLTERGATTGLHFIHYSSAGGKLITDFSS